jgi:hypothetical protein
MWDWLGAEVQAQRVSIPAVALQEVTDSSPPCSSWLQGHQAWVLDIGTTELTFAAAVKSQLGLLGACPGLVTVVKNTKVNGQKSAKPFLSKKGIQKHHLYYTLGV